MAVAIWHCYDCNTTGEEQHFFVQETESHLCPKCKSEDVFLDEKFRGSECKGPLSEESFHVKVGETCPRCEKSWCKVERKTPRTINFFGQSSQYNILIICNQDVPNFPNHLQKHQGGKFIVLKDGRFFIGNVDLHAALLVLSKTESYNGLDPEQIVAKYSNQVLTAGHYDANGDITWGSTGFKIFRAPFDQKLCESIKVVVKRAIVDESRLIE